MSHTQPSDNSRFSATKTPYLSLALLTFLYLAIALAHTVLAPLTTGPDELAHYEYLNFIAEHGRLPLDIQERAQASYKSDQPPLYHLIAAIPAALVDPTGPPVLKRVGDHPRRQLIERTRHAWGLYNTEDEQWPYRAEVLRWQVGRWVAILFGAATLIITFFIARELFAKLPITNYQLPITNYQLSIINPKSLSLAAAAIVAFIPRFALTGSMLNYETTLAFLAALFLWVLLRLATGVREQGSRGAGEQGLRITHRVPHFTIYTLALGLFAGLAITTKLSALILPLEIVIGLGLIARDQAWPWRTWFRAVLTAALGALLAVSWWFGFVLYQFNTIAQDGWWTGLLRPLIAADASDATTNRLLSALTGGQAGFTGAIDNLGSGPPWDWAAIFFRTFWVAGIEQQQPLGWFGLAVALLLCLVATYGLVNLWSRGAGERRSRGAEEQGSGGAGEQRITDHGSRITDHAPRLPLSLLLLHLFLPLFLPLLRYAVTFSLADTAQGRHVLFLAAPAFAILLVWGWSVAGNQLSVISNRLSETTTPYAIRTTRHVLHFIPFLPPLFLLFWAMIQLWTMSWAYHPLLPVGTTPEAKAQATERLDQAINGAMTLLGFERQLAAGGRLLRLDLIWQATGISPVDYLTEVYLLDEQGDVQAEWLGYPAGGRYPTRAWDTGDIVRDTVWLSLAGLRAGAYSLTFNLVTNSARQPQKIFDAPQPLTTVELDRPVALATAPQIWQEGQLVTTPQLFNYRETVLVMLGEQFAGRAEVTARLVGPQERAFEPALRSNNTALFIVGPDWPTGDYRLRITPAMPNAPPVESAALVQVVDRWQRQFSQPAMQRRVEANFANQVKLLGYDLGANRAEPGGGIPLTLYWQGLDWLGDDYTIFVKLLAPDQTVYGGRDRLPQEGYRTLYWAPGEIVVDPFGLPVDAGAPDGIYTINLGLYKQVGEQAIPLPLVQDGQPIEVTSINIGPIKIGDTPPGQTVETANPQVRLDQPFGDAPNLTLLGYDLTDAAGQPITNNQLPMTNHQLLITLYWRSEAPVPVDYTTFVHLRNAAGEVVAQKDQPPLNGAYPTSLWEPGEMIADEIVLPLPSELSTGAYHLFAGLYDFQTGQRLATPEHPANEIRLVTVEIP